MSNSITKEYTNGEITIVWKPQLCIHSGVCVKRLPNVYDPKAKPWVKPENASTEELKSQIDQCPSGALTYKLNNKTTKQMEDQKQETTVDVLKAGPLVVKGNLCITNADGTVVNKERASFCRCGASANKPFCDGSHKGIDWVG